MIEGFYFGAGPSFYAPIRNKEVRISNLFFTSFALNQSFILKLNELLTKRLLYYF
jgi:hypothetical protein